MVSEERAAELLAENAELRERIAEIARDAQEAIEDNSQMAAIFEADDRLAAAMAEIKLAQAEVVSAQRAACRSDRHEKRSHQIGEVLQGEVRKGGCA